MNKKYPPTYFSMFFYMKVLLLCKSMPGFPTDYDYKLCFFIKHITNSTTHWRAADGILIRGFHEKHVDCSWSFYHSKHGSNNLPSNRINESQKDWFPYWRWCDWKSWKIIAVNHFMHPLDVHPCLKLVVEKNDALSKKSCNLSSHSQILQV